MLTPVPPVACTEILFESEIVPRLCNRRDALHRIRAAEDDEMSGEPAQFDLNAAWFRKAQGDLGTFVEGFAARMMDALPGRVTVERRGVVLFGRRRVAKVSVAFDAEVYALALDGGAVRAERAAVVRGVTLRSERMSLPDWLAALQGEVGRLADRSSTAQAVLHDFLMS